MDTQAVAIERCDHKCQIPKSDKDTILMLQTANGDDACFEPLYNKYLLVVINYMRHKNLPSAVEPKDIAQEVFLRIWRDRKNFRNGSKFITYLFGYAKNVLREQKATMGHAITVNDDMLSNLESNLPLANTEVEYKDVTKHVKGILIKLPIKQRITFESICINELTVTEAAELIGCSNDSIYNNLHRARKQLRKMIDNLRT